MFIKFRAMIFFSSLSCIVQPGTFPGIKCLPIAIRELEQQQKKSIYLYMYHTFMKTNFVTLLENIRSDASEPQFH